FRSGWIWASVAARRRSGPVISRRNMSPSTATIGVDMSGGDVTDAGPPAPDLPVVRRFEAAGARAWPATSVYYDGAWAVRLTASHPAKRLNSINPLDPGDDGNLPERIARLGREFEAYGRPLTFRMSPLSGRRIE